MAAKTSSSAASSSTPQWKYDVFLSFRGEDTRRGFTDHLYRALDKKGICTYRDDEKLERDKTIRPELLKAIEESRFAVIVFSRDYASSTWCLDEVSKIAECMKGTGQTVIPIFYPVEPSEIRKQKDAFEKAFAEHEEVFKNNLGKVNEWREALSEIANVSGCDLQHRHESEFIDEIVKAISNKLNLPSYIVDDDLVGMDCRMEKVLSQLDIGRSDDVRVVGIWRMPGIGKTTLAQQVLGKIGDQFEACCFVPDIGEESDKHGLINLQNRLLRSLLASEANIQSDGMGINIIRDRLRQLKVLIILDDVDDFKQLEALAGKGDLGGPGSRVIVTTRDKQVLKKFENVYICEVDKLTTEEALKLFRNKAFTNNRNADEYGYESREVVKYADGLPLALEVLGSFLRGRTQEEWSDTLARLKEYPEIDIMVPLRVSYDGLSESEKKTFLDIACFFKGEDEFRVTRILKECDGVYQDIDILVLKEKSLINIVGGKIWMHDLLQELGRQIVHGEPPEEPGKRSRLSHSSSLELPHSFTGLFSLKTLDPSQCNLPERGIPNDLGSLSLLEKLNLSENNFRSVPQSIFQLSNLRELSLNRCNQLESLPNLPPSIKLVFARDCANLRNSNKYTAWTSKKGLCLIDCRKSGEDEGPTFDKIPIAIENVHRQLQNIIEDEVRQGRGFDHAFPCTGIPNWCSDNSDNGSSIIIELPPELDVIEWMGFALGFYMSQKQEQADPPPPGDSIDCDIMEFSCRFETVEGPLENSLDFPVFIGRHGGSFGHCKYIPREWFAGQLDKASQVEVSISAISQEVEVTMCGAHIIYEQNVTKFVQNLYRTSEEDLALASRYQQTVDHASKSAIIDEIDSIIGERKFIDKIEEQQRECTSAETSQETEEDSISLNSFLIHVEAQTNRHRSSTNHKSDCRREIMASLSRLFQECYARNFNFACIFPLNAILPWFTYRCVGSQMPCCLPPTLFDDEAWIGFAVYVVFTWNPSVSLEDLDPVFPPFLFAHLQTNRSKVQHTTMFSLGKDGLIGSEHRLVIFYVPRTHFQQELKQCSQISALFCTTIPDHVKIEICGIRSVYEKDLKELIQTITECSLESPDVHHRRYYQTFENMEKKISHQAGTSSECNVTEGEEPMKVVDLGYFYSSSQREQESFYEQVPEDVEVPTSRQNIQSDSRYAGSQMNTPTENGHDITSHLIKKYYQGFDPELIHNLCFPPSDIPKGFKNQNEDYSVRIQLPLDSYNERNWIGLALWASFSINEQSTTPTIQEQDSGVPHWLFCNLETDGGTLEPLYYYQTTNEESKWLHRKRGLVWLSYIPCGWFKNKLNQCSFLEASFGSESRGMRVQKCGLSFVYGKHAEEFEFMIEHSAKVFLEDWDLIQEILVEKDAASLETSSDQTITQGSSSNVAPSFVLLDIMAEPPFFESHYSTNEWKRNLENLLKKFFKISLVIEPSLMKHQISVLHGFEPNFDYNFCFPRKEIPQWFKFQNSGPEMIIELLNDSWLGVAICVSFTVHENPAAFLDNAGSEIQVNLRYYFKTNECCVNSRLRIPKEEFKWKHTGGFIWFTYKTRFSFPGSINQQSHLVIRIDSDCPGLEVQSCGFNLLYEQNVKEFEQTIIQCLTSFDDLDPIFEYLGTRVKDIALDSNYRSSDNPHNARMSASSGNCSQDVHLYSGKYNQLDFDKNLVYDSCFPPTEVLDWFRNHGVGPSTQVQLAPDLFGEDNWIGLALCAYFSYPIYEHPTTFSDNLDTQISHHLICHLETERSSLPDPHSCKTTNEEFKWLIDGGRFLWLLYLPRGWFPDQLKHCSSMKASFASDYESLSVQKCGLRLVYRHDEGELKKTINHCKSLLFEYRERDHVHLHNENANKQGQGGESDSGSATSGSSTKVDPLQERLRTPNEPDLKDKGKRILNNLSGSFPWEDHK